MERAIAVCRNGLNYILALGVLIAFYGIGEQLSAWIALPITGALYGLALLLGFMGLRPAFARWLSQAIYPLLKHMVFFFIPATMSVSLYGALWQEYGIAIFVAVFITTTLALAITAWATQKLLTLPTGEKHGQ